MPWLRIGRQPDVATTLFQRLDHLNRLGGRHYLVFCAVECSRRYVLEGTSFVGVASSTYGYQRCEKLRVGAGKVPRAVAAHAETGKVDARSVYGVALEGILEQGTQIIEQLQLVKARWILRGDDPEEG